MATYAWKQNPTVEKQIGHRTIENSIPRLITILDSLPDDIIVLDVGCGPGSITCDVAKRYPSATVLGIDYSPQIIEVARQCAKEAGLSNVRFAIGDALDLAAVAVQPGFEALRGGCCDAVWTHQIFLHVQDAEILMQELHAAAKPQGGVICCLESDPTIMTQHPPSPAMDIAWQALFDMFQRGGQDIHAAQHMETYARRVGFHPSDIDFSPLEVEFKTLAEKEGIVNLALRSFRHTAADLTGKVISEEELQRALDAADEWMKRDDGFLRFRCYQIVCERREKSSLCI